MKKKIKKTGKLKKYFIIGFLVIITIIIIFTTILYLKNIVLASPYIPITDFCSDSDANTPNQYNVAGNVLYIYSQCSLLNLNVPNSTTGDLCAYELNYNDFCINSNTLREKICVNNKVSSTFINCPNGCVNGKCV